MSTPKGWPRTCSNPLCRREIHFGDPDRMTVAQRPRGGPVWEWHLCGYPCFRAVAALWDARMRVAQLVDEEGLVLVPRVEGSEP